MSDEEAVAPVQEQPQQRQPTQHQPPPPQESQQQIPIDPEKVITVLRQENEELRHQLRLTQIAFQDVQGVAASLRREIDAFALHMEAEKQGKSLTPKKAKKNGAKSA